ncbi:Adenylate kinase [Pseudomonas sp. NFACC15-1]|uniref:AAA family ATPase n=1 Tax=unclassified Pseudomonas TaxID=196821 RepID=UPI000887C1FE|nr:MULTISPECIES: AAA family ATPase [unclassified Pseudomonas]SDA96805.1 Adenylate kinase [Pseudomonas sp. NFACC15-1]SDX09690.1 Adenylate kinase [Pseudomonas sp. NFACC14]
MKRLLLLSGPMAGGKTSVSAVLQEHFGYLSISSGSFLRVQLISQGEVPDRHKLQELGDSLDRSTDFSWLIDSIARPAIDAQPDVDNWLLDAVRKSRQVELFKLHFAGAVMHAHIDAPESVLRQRYAERGPNHLAEYHENVRHPNEVSARSLGNIADKVFDTGTLTAFEVARQIIKLWEE